MSVRVSVLGFFPCSFQYFSFASLSGSYYKSHMIEQISSPSHKFKIVHSQALVRYLLVKVPLTEVATAVLTTPPLALEDLKNNWIILFSPPHSKDFPPSFDLNSMLDDQFWTFTNLSSLVLFFKGSFGAFFNPVYIQMKWIRVFKVSFLLANYPIWNQSVSLYF